LIGAKKVVIWICFFRSGIESLVFLPPRETFNREFFVEKVLADFDEEVAQNRPKNPSRGTFLHFDSAMPLRAPQDFDRLGITRLSHPSYSPDLVPCDFWIFKTRKRRLERCMFRDPVEVMTAVSTILSKIPLDEFISVFDE
jgi:hypothetical protein